MAAAICLCETPSVPLFERERNNSSPLAFTPAGGAAAGEMHSLTRLPPAPVERWDFARGEAEEEPERWDGLA